MDYESIKHDFGKVISGNALLTSWFFFICGRIFLRVRYVKAALKRLIPQLGVENPAVLDAGSGYGFYSHFIARQFPSARVTSGDIQENYLENFRCFAREAGLENIAVERIDLTGMEFEERFDMAISIDVLEHIMDDEKVFRNIFRALKKGGCFLMHTPHISENPSGHNYGAYNDDHVRAGYSSADIQQKLGAAGFERTECTLTYGRWGHIAWKMLQRLPIYLLGKNKLFYLLLPIYYPLVYPLAELFMWIDTRLKKREGGGILVSAWKPQ